MNTEVRFILAIALMLGVLVGTNLLFPPVPPDPAALPDSAATTAGGSSDSVLPELPGQAAPPVVGGQPVIPAAEEEAPAARPPSTEAVAKRTVTVESGLYRIGFSNYGALLESAVLPRFPALNRSGPVDLVPEEVDGYFGQRLVMGSDTLDLTRVPFQVEPEGGLDLGADPSARTLRFTYQHPTNPFRFEIAYEFDPERYQVVVNGRVTGLDRALLVTEIGDGLAFAEADSSGEARAMAYVYNHLQDGIKSTIQTKAEPTVVDGPLLWVAFRSKYFVIAMLAGESDEALADEDYLGGLLVGPSALPERVNVGAAQTVGSDGAFAYRLFMGPQDYARLSSLGQGMEEVNPYGYRFIRPIVRPFVSVILTILTFLHSNLNVGYGWVLIIFGVAMRVVLFPLNHKAMKANLRNMAVQPLVQEVQAKYKENPEKLQKEMMKLYKDHGFNPLAGCLPMLLPWPVLIALFFVFQNTIELRGVPFLWLPDLSAPDPLYLLPVFLGLSMFLMQWVNMRSLDKPNAQMKMMMWLMPGMMVVIFLNFASGLNLYYATANIATLPQSIWIARERKKMQGMPPPKRSSD